jgi:hypothetical protein
MQTAEKVAAAFQKNPYQTAEQILAKLPGGKNKDLEFLKSIWRDSDLQAMKTEMNRLGLLKAHVAQNEYLKKTKKPATNWQDLKTVVGFEQTPIDYFTGRPMERSRLGAAEASSRTTK